MLEQIGLFDEDFFSYAEDLDLGLRSRLYGWTSFFCPGTKVIHLHSQSTGAASSFKAYYVKRNINFVAIKNLPIALLGRFVLYSCLNNIRILLKIRRRNSSINQLSQRITPIGLIGLFFKIFIDTAKHIPKMLRKRRAILPHRAISDRDLSMLFATFGS
jgi:GT2 family glycosyltransferase